MKVLNIVRRAIIDGVRFTVLNRMRNYTASIPLFLPQYNNAIITGILEG